MGKDVLRIALSGWEIEREVVAVEKRQGGGRQKRGSDERKDGGREGAERENSCWLHAHVR